MRYRAPIYFILFFVALCTVSHSIENPLSEMKLEPIRELHEHTKFEYECDYLISSMDSDHEYNTVLSWLYENVWNPNLVAEGEGPDIAFLQICLDFPGGRIDYVKKIANYFERLIEAGFSGNITTVIPEGATCKSACAFLFMAGFSCGSYHCQPSRALHAGGTLGFHAPFPEWDAPINDKKVLTLMYGRAMNDLAFFIKLNSNERFTHDRFNFLTISKILEKRGGDFYYIKTIRDVLEIKADLFGSFQEVPDNPISNLCNNLHARGFDTRDTRQIDLVDLFEEQASGNLQIEVKYANSTTGLLSFIRWVHYANRGWSGCSFSYGNVRISSDNDVMAFSDPENQWSARGACASGVQTLSSTCDDYAGAPAEEVSSVDIPIEWAVGYLRSMINDTNRWLFFPMDTPIKDLLE